MRKIWVFFLCAVISSNGFGISLKGLRELIAKLIRQRNAVHVELASDLPQAEKEKLHRKDKWLTARLLWMTKRATVAADASVEQVDLSSIPGGAHMDEAALDDMAESGKAPDVPNDASVKKEVREALLRIAGPGGGSQPHTLTDVDWLWSTEATAYDTVNERFHEVDCQVVRLSQSGRVIAVLHFQKRADKDGDYRYHYIPLVHIDEHVSNKRAVVIALLRLADETARKLSGRRIRFAFPSGGKVSLRFQKGDLYELAGEYLNMSWGAGTSFAAGGGSSNGRISGGGGCQQHIQGGGQPQIRGSQGQIPGGNSPRLQ